MGKTQEEYIRLLKQLELEKLKKLDKDYEKFVADKKLKKNGSK